MTNIEFIDENVRLDPRLQITLDRQTRNALRTDGSLNRQGDIAVLAVVNDPKVWQERTDFRPVAELGKTRDGKNWIISARVPLSRVPDIRADPRVVSLKGAQQTGPVLHATVPEILAAPDNLPTGSRRGKGAVVGIIDYGCDFAHLNFRNPDGTTRIEALWDQAGTLQGNSTVQFGRVYSKAAINAALKAADPYGALGYNPDPGQVGMHGTHVMDIAAGSGRGSGVSGVAPESTIIFVDLSTDDIPWTGEASLTTKLGDSVHLVEALDWIFRTAGDRPCAINISLGTNCGPHDGSTPFEQALDALVAAVPNRAVVIAASNSYDHHIHATHAVARNSSFDLNWVIPRTGPGPNEMEIWYGGADEFEFELLDDQGKSFGIVGLGKSARIKDDNGQTLVFISHRKTDPLNGDNVIGVYLEGSLQQKSWTARIHGKTVGGKGEFHAWVERNDGAQSLFKGAGVVDSYTLGSLACGYRSIVVSSYDAHYPGAPISFFSSAGPTRDGRNKPEVSAPGQDVIAARSATGTGVIRKSGTSMAAPAVTGAIAVMLSQPNVKMDATDIQKAVIGSARLSPPPTGAPWDVRYGHGRISAAQMLALLKAVPAAAASSRRKVRRNAAKAAKQTKTAKKTKATKKAKAARTRRR